jgi:hypothetical protein
MHTRNCSQFQYLFQLQCSSCYKKLKEQNLKIPTVIFASPLIKINEVYLNSYKIINLVYHVFYAFENVSPVFVCLHQAEVLNPQNVSSTAYIHTFPSPRNKILGSLNLS